jgi:hypothetical protein
MPHPPASVRLLGLIFLGGLTLSGPSSGFQRTSIVDLPPWRVETGADGVEARVIQLPYEQASYDFATHDLGRRVLDQNQDGISDRIITYAGLGGARLEEIDTDFSGTVDRWDTFGPEGQRLRSATARFGNRPDRVATYTPAGQLNRVETDSDLDGNFEHTQIFEGGILAEVRLDSDHNRRPDRVQNYRPGYLADEEFDADEDGEPDLRMTFAREGGLVKVLVLKPSAANAGAPRR